MGLDRIKQSDNQLSYLQAQLAATELLYSAYQAELQGLSKELDNVKQSHLRSGLPLWKDAGPAMKAALAQRQQQRQPKQQQASPAVPSEGDPDTYSDIEEEVLLLQAEKPAAAEDLQVIHNKQQQQQQLQGATAPGASSQGNTAAAVDGEPGPHSSVDVGGLAAGEGAAAVEGAAAAAVTAGTDGVASAATAPAGTPEAAAREGLEALEATCSAVAQEDMEVQGAVACLAGRTAKYYLRSTVVSLGRTTDTKGDVDLDLTLEEPPPSRAPPRGASAGDQGVAQPLALPAGAGHMVSRRQALIRLGPDGQFRLVNTGRQAVVVNDVVVSQNHTVNLPHLSLIEVASVRMLFMANLAAVARVVRRSAALSL